MRVMGIAIEGLGIDTSKSDGITLCDVATVPTTGNREWINALTQTPGTLTTRVDPFTGSWTAPSATFRVSRSSRLATLLLASEPAASTTLASALTSGATTVVFSAAGYSAGDVVWVGDEAILLGTLSTAVSFTGCTRGFWGTDAQAHSAGAETYARNNFLFRRKVRVVSLSGGVETTRWTGMVRNIKQVGPHIEVVCDSLLQTIMSARRNIGAYNYRPHANLNADRLAWGAKTADRVRTGATSGAYFEAFQVGEKLCAFVKQDASQPAESILPIVNFEQGVAFGASARFSDIDKTVLEDADSVYRVLCIDRNLDTAIGSTVSATGALAKPYHPIAIALALLTSTGTGTNGSYDVLGSRWGLGITSLDFADFEAEITARPDLAIDRLVLGWGGKEFSPHSIIKDKLLRPYGYSLSMNSTGDLSLVKLRFPDLTTRTEAVANAVRLYPTPLPEQDPNMSARSRVLQLKVGGEPTGNARTVEVTLANRSTRAGRLEHTPTMQIDLSTVNPERITGGQGLTEYAQAIIQALAFGIDSPPILRARIANPWDSGTDIACGDWISVADDGIEGAWWVDSDGNAIELDGTGVESVGLVVGLSVPFSGSHADVEVLMMGHGLEDYIRLVGPSGAVDSWDGVGFVVDLDNTRFTSDDAATFAIGDELALFDANGGTKGSSNPTITGIASNQLTLDGGFGATPVNGDIIRLADSTVYSNTAHITGVGRPFAFIADAASFTFEDADANTTFDEYGSEMFVGSSAPVAKGSAPAFIAIDSDAITATGTSDEEAQPLDTFLLQTVEDDLSWLLTREIGATQLLDTHHGDTLGSSTLIRPFCSADWATVQVVPVMMQSGWSGARCSIVARVANEYSETTGYDNDEEVYFRLDLYGPDWKRIKKGTRIVVGHTAADTPEFQGFDVTLELDKPVTEAGFGYLVLWVSSKASPVDDETTDTAGTFTFGTTVPNTDNQSISYIVDTSNTFLDDTASTRPNQNDFALSSLAAARWGSNGAFADDQQDILWRRVNGSNVEVIVGPDPVGGGFVNDIYRYTLTYAQIRSLEWMEWYTDIGRPPASLLEPDAPVLGEIAGGHVTRTARVYSTPRLSHVGPPGDVDDPYSGATGYAQRWPRERHDNATPTEIVNEAIIIPSRLNPTLIIMGLVAPTFCVPNFKDFRPENPLDPDWITSAQWDIYADFYAPDSGSGWGSLGTVTQEFTFAHWYTFASQQGLLTSELAHYSGNFPYREGSMYAKDLQYLQPFVLVAENVSYDPRTDDEFIRVRLRFDGIDTPTYTGNTHQDYRSRDRLQLALAGWAIYEVPA